MGAKRKAAIEAALLELNISHIAPNKFYGPRRPLAESKPQSGSCKVEHKWGPQKFETLTCLGKSWRSSI